MSAPAESLQHLQHPRLDPGSAPVEPLIAALESSTDGLLESEALRRLEALGPNEPARKKKRTLLFDFVSKLFNPLVIVLLIIAAFSFFFGERISATLVTLM